MYKDKEYQKKYYQKNKERIEKYRQEHHKERDKAYREKNKEHSKVAYSDWIEKNKKHKKEYMEEYRQKTKEHRKEYQFKHKYNLDLTQIDEMLANQEHKCLICGESLVEKKRYIDHNHKTGQVRDILCIRCNSGLGFIEDTKFLEAALEYLRKWNLRE